MFYYDGFRELYTFFVFSILGRGCMKKIQVIFLLILCGMIVLPLVKFNLKKECVSPIDNRMLTEWDMTTGDITGMTDAYIKDRIGFRTEAIDSYTELNDKLFGMMIHPSYTYGTDGYVFGRMSYELPDEGFYDLFCAYLKKVQNYCEERNVPFLYCLNPSKVTVYEQYLPKGYSYQNKVNKIMKEKLEEYQIHYISNEELLKEKSKKEQVYNIKFDAGHWNDLGAFYGSNHVLESVQEEFPQVSLIEKDDFDIHTVVQTSLPVSHFEIYEEVPAFSDKNQENIENISEAYGGIKLNENYHEFSYLVNHAVGSEELPRVLMFQGSYYNGRQQFLQSTFREYITVHNYENFIDLDYYFNIFQPDYVILESAEYATNGNYFSYWGLETKELNPKLEIEEYEKEIQFLEEYSYEVEEQGNLVTIRMNMDSLPKRGYLIVGNRQFDFSINTEEETITCTVDKQYFADENIKVLFQ